MWLHILVTIYKLKNEDAEILVKFRWQINNTVVKYLVNHGSEEYIGSP